MELPLQHRSRLVCGAPASQHHPDDAQLLDQLASRLDQSRTRAAELADARQQLADLRQAHEAQAAELGRAQLELRRRQAEDEQRQQLATFVQSADLLCSDEQVRTLLRAQRVNKQGLAYLAIDSAKSSVANLTTLLSVPGFMDLLPSMASLGISRDLLSQTETLAGQLQRAGVLRESKGGRGRGRGRGEGRVRDGGRGPEQPLGRLSVLPPGLLAVICSYGDAARTLSRLDCLCRSTHSVEAPASLTELLGASIARSVFQIADVPRPRRGENASELLLFFQRCHENGRRRVAAGDSHALLVTGDRELQKGSNLYCFGSGAAVGGGAQNPSSPIAGERVITASASSNHSLMVTDAGKVLSVGAGRNWVLGHGSLEAEAVPRPIGRLSGIRVTAVASSVFHSVALGEDGRLYSWGSGGHGQLGHGGPEHEPEPRQVLALHQVRVTAVSCGWAHTVAIDSRGVAHAFGHAGDGRLGLGDGVVGEVGSGVMSPSPVSSLKHLKLVDAQAGYNHTIFLSDGGAVLACGEASPKLGLGEKGLGAAVRTPELVKIPLNAQISRLATSVAHSILLTKSGMVLTCGDGHSGKLGLGDADDRAKPTVVTGPLEGEEAVDCAAGEETSLILCRSGKLYSFGRVFTAPPSTSAVPRELNQLIDN